VASRKWIPKVTFKCFRLSLRGKKNSGTAPETVLELRKHSKTMAYRFETRIPSSVSSTAISCCARRNFRREAGIGGGEDAGDVKISKGRITDDELSRVVAIELLGNVP
jgi:hypothetical protein